MSNTEVLGRVPPPHPAASELEVQRWRESVWASLFNVLVNPQLRTEAFRAVPEFCFYHCDCTGGDISVTLPPPRPSLGQFYAFKKTDSNPGRIVLNSPALIDGITPRFVADQNALLGVVSNGDTWLIGVSLLGGGGVGDLSYSLVSANRKNNVQDMYLRSTDGVSLNITPWIIPFDSQLIGMSASSVAPANAWTAELRSSLVPVLGAALSVTATGRAFDGNMAVNLAQGEEISTFVASSGPVKQPHVTLFIRRR